MTDFERFNGEKIKVKLYSPIENQKKYQGKLLGLKENLVQLELDKNKILEVPFDEIQLARLDPDL
jgi:ribosome maturation factor RimP